MSHIFISYARKDIEFASQIVQALAKQDLDTWIDWKSIPKGEEWEQEIYRGIEEADAFLFLISPYSVVSEMCNKEIGHAVRNGKRILPIVISDTETRTIHPEISKRNWIFCRNERDILNKAIEETCRTIHTDFEWLKYHTQLQNKALAWERTQKDTSRLLRGKELREAEQQFAEISDHEDPQPTILQRHYILSSRKHEDKQRRRITSGLSVGFIVVLIIASVAVWQWQRADEQAQIALTRQLAAQSILELSSDPELGLLLATEAVERNADMAFNKVPLEPEHALHQALLTSRLRTTLPYNEPINALTFSSNGKLLAIVGKTTISMWDIVDKTIMFSIPHNYKVAKATFSFDGEYLATYGDNDVHLWKTNNGKAYRVLHHENFVKSVIFNSNGKWVTTRDNNGVVRLWNITGGSVLRTFTCERQICEIADGINGPLVATVDQNGRGVIKNLTSHQQAFSIRGLDSNIQDLFFDQSGRWLIVKYEDHEIILWDVLLNQLIARLAYQQGQGGSIAISPDGNWLAVTDSGGIVRIWDVINNTWSNKLAVEGYTSYGGGFLEFIFSSNQNQLLVFPSALNDGGPEYAGRFNSATLWNTITAEQVAVFLQDQLTAITISQDGNVIATAGKDQNRNSIKLWDTMASEFASWDMGSMQSIVLSPEGTRMAVRDDDNKTRVIDLDNKNGYERLSFTNINRLAFSPKADRLVTISPSGTTQLWNILTGQPLNTLSEKEVSFAFSPKGDLLAIARNGVIHLWDTRSGQVITNTGYQINGVSEASKMVFNANGNLLAIHLFYSTEEQKIIIFDLALAQVVGDFLVGYSQPLDIVFSPDGSRLVTVGREVALMWDLATKESIPLEGHGILPGLGNVISDVEFTSDGDYFATAGSDGTARLWDADTGNLLSTLRGHSDQVVNVIFSPDGKRLATASNDGTVRLWDVRSKKQITVFGYPRNGLLVDSNPWIANSEIAFTQDGKLLTTVSRDGKLNVYYTQAHDLLTLSCSRLSRNLSREEWIQYLGNEPYRATCPSIQ